MLDWSKIDELQFHQTQCKELNFGGHDVSAHFLIGAEYFPFVNQIEEMGFIESSSSSWKPHVESKLLKCNRIFGFLKRSIPFSVSGCKKSFFTNPYLVYFALPVPMFLSC